MPRTNTTPVFSMAMALLPVFYFALLFFKTWNILAGAWLAGIVGPALAAIPLWICLVEKRNGGILSGMLAGLLCGMAALCCGLAGLLIEAHYFRPGPSVFFYGALFTALLRGLAIYKVFVVLQGWAVLAASSLLGGIIAGWRKRQP